MPSRENAPIGSPCWADLWTSDVEGSRAFYAALFGWEAQEPSPEFGGYFMFTRNGVPVAGAMGDMGEMKATNTWKIYLDTDDVTKALEVAKTEGAQIISPAMPVADLGTQAVLIDPTGAEVGAWQAGTFPGFTVLDEPGAPSWFELYTRDHAGAVAFYRSVFTWETNTISDSDEFRYTTMQDPSGDGELAGIMDAARSSRRGFPVLVDLLGSRGRRCNRLQGRGPWRFGRDGSARHPLRPPCRCHGPRRSPVQPAQAQSVGYRAPHC